MGNGHSLGRAVYIHVYFRTYAAAATRKARSIATAKSTNLTFVCGLFAVREVHSSPSFISDRSDDVK